MGQQSSHQFYVNFYISIILIFFSFMIQKNWHLWGLLKHLCVCLSVCMYVCLSVCLFVRPSVHPSVCPSIRPSVCPSVRPSVCQSIYLNVYRYLPLPYTLNSFCKLVSVTWTHQSPMKYDTCAQRCINWMNANK